MAPQPLSRSHFLARHVHVVWGHELGHPFLLVSVALLCSPLFTWRFQPSSFADKTELRESVTSFRNSPPAGAGSARDGLKSERRTFVKMELSRWQRYRMVWIFTGV